MLRLISVRIAIAAAAGAAARERIWVTIAAAPGRHRVALFQAGKPAASHSRGDVGTAIVGVARCRRRRRRHGDKAKRKRRRCGRNGRLQKLSHLLWCLSVGKCDFGAGSAPHRRCDAEDHFAIDVKKK